MNPHEQELSGSLPKELLPLKKVILASNNSEKTQELRSLFAPHGLEIVGFQESLDPIEDACTFQDNALIKARAYALASGLPALADDSGLCVNALGGRPGVHSARYAVHPETWEKDFSYGMNRLQQELEAIGSADYSAYFMCVLCLYWPHGQYRFFEGRVEGRLTFPPLGTHGFGYDKVFVPNGQQNPLTFGQMSQADKQMYSHRANACQYFIQAIKGNI